MRILLVHAVRFQIATTQLELWLQHCSNGKHQLSAMNYAILPIPTPRSCCYHRILETRTCHKPRPVGIEMFRKPNCYFWDSGRVYGCNCAHTHSLSNVLEWEVLDIWQCFETSHCISALAACISRYSCWYTICVSIAWWSMSPYRTTTTIRFTSSIQLVPPVSDLSQCWHPRMYTVTRDVLFHTRTPLTWGISNSRPKLSVRLELCNSTSGLGEIASIHK